MNGLAEIIWGLLLPGNPVANMVLKAYSAQMLVFPSSRSSSSDIDDDDTS